MVSKKLKIALGILLATTALTGCETIDDNRIPSVPVNLPFQSVGMWNTFGIGGAMDSRVFINTYRDCVPVNFPYTASMYTGYGGILLVGDVYGNPLAYDLSCPVECSPNVRITVDYEHNDAYCPVCGSSYDIFAGNGYPTGGRAAEMGWGLTRYRVVQTPSSYMTVIN